MIELREPVPPALPEDLAEAERRLAELGHELPPSYREFLLEHDGGEPVRERFSFDDDGAASGSLIGEFLSARPAASPRLDLVKAAGLLNERIPRGVVPIAIDQGGNFVCVDTRGGADGPVLLWDHEREAEPADESNLTWLAPDLAAFLDGLEEPPPPPEPERRGWRKLLGG